MPSDIDRRRFTAPFELKGEVSDAGEFTGHAAVFGVRDRVGDVIKPGAFARTLGEWKAKGQRPGLYWEHDPRLLIGEVDLEEDAKGLAVAGRVWIDPPAVNEAVMVYRGMKAKSIRNMSFSFKAVKKTFEGNTRFLHDVDVGEITVTSRPVNTYAEIDSVKGEIPEIRAIEDALRDAGLSHREAKALLAEGYRALSVTRDADTDEAKGNEETLEAVRRLDAIMRGELK